MVGALVASCLLAPTGCSESFEAPDRAVGDRTPRTGRCDEPAEAHGGWDYLGHEKIDGSPEPAPYSRGVADDCSAGAPLLSWDVGQDASGYQDNSSPPFLAERGSGHWASPRGGFPAQSNLSSSRGFGADGGAYSDDD